MSGTESIREGGTTGHRVGSEITGLFVRCPSHSTRCNSVGLLVLTLPTSSLGPVGLRGYLTPSMVPASSGRVGTRASCFWHDLKLGFDRGEIGARLIRLPHRSHRDSQAIALAVRPNFERHPRQIRPGAAEGRL